MPKGRAPQKSTATKKRKWIPMEIYRVPLNPEQAVLSCCSNTVRGMNRVYGTLQVQCINSVCAWYTDPMYIPSS
jgi:hypothetical protein